MELLYILVGIAVGFVVGWLLMKNKSRDGETALQKRLGDAEQEKAALTERASQQKQQIEQVSLHLEEERNRAGESGRMVVQLKTTNENLAEMLTTQKAELEDLQNRFNKEFENL